LLAPQRKSVDAAVLPPLRRIATLQVLPAVAITVPPIAVTVIVAVVVVSVGVHVHATITNPDFYCGRATGDWREQTKARNQKQGGFLHRFLSFGFSCTRRGNDVGKDGVPRPFAALCPYEWPFRFSAADTVLDQISTRKSLKRKQPVAGNQHALDNEISLASQTLGCADLKTT
jgi:hypothetical protein